MLSSVKIEQLLTVEAHIVELSNLLIQTVEDGASIGFLPPLHPTEANEYWKDVLNTETILLVAKIDNHIVGSIQLHLNTKQNGSHRAEIAKLMTNPNYRRMGIGRQLMKQAEERAKREGRTVLVLDTREGDPSNLLYSALGYIEAGKIPYYAKSANGELHATVFYYKTLMD
ncbi:GNAT family N-acetyltransferase [Ureibacillus sinduriensis]|uniref:GCN5 family acetyltransferase n=1 Tax=Ureibacillus sinduriensis BLB-1 = JCM 15800 TaxID=1384057 RepID=A0A0A3HT48_9BACL|nr:GNAT family N-acetyltransferase [Ureibacillus sinduriensis]KGR74375.1 GCN5 family acetyltransferase [Ureibacillus sinduriensis BLB-1 = JCM 15800]